MQEEANHFLDAIHELRQEYQTVEVRVVAIQWMDLWLNLSTRAILNINATPKRPTVLSKRDVPPNLILNRKIVPIDRLDDLIAIFQTGSLELDANRISYQRFSGTKPTEPYNCSFSLSDRKASKEDFGIDSHCFCLTGREQIIDRTIGHRNYGMIESRVTSLKKPFTGLGDLIEAFTGHRLFSNESWSSSSIEIIAPVNVRFSNRNLIRDNELSVEAEIEQGHHANYVSVGIIEREGDRVVHRSRPEGTQATEEERTLLSIHKTLKPETNVIESLLSYRGVKVDKLDLFRNRTGKKNPRVRLMASIDPELMDFKKGLEGTAKRKGGGLEEAALQLMTFLGFSCLPIGWNEKNADIIAATSNPSLAFIIECTTAEPDLRNKTTKFTSRIRQIRKSSGLKQVVGLMVTTLNEDLINSADKERLKDDGIFLIDKKKIDTLWKMAQAGKGEHEVIEFLKMLELEQAFTRTVLHKGRQL